MEPRPLRAGVLRLLEATRNEEWTLDRSLGEERECPSLRESALDDADEDLLSAEPGIPRDHPQYLWRHVAIFGARGPFESYSAWHHVRAARSRRSGC